ncbi:MAG: hypothetical protein ACK416_06235, partial [Zestosphaera sp.]
QSPSSAPTSPKIPHKQPSSPRLNQSTDKKIVFEVCPGGCLLGGGQPVSRGNDLTKVLVRRKDMLERLRTEKNWNP